MTNSWMTVRVKYTREMENGTFKRVTEHFLVAGLTFGETEERIYEELAQTIRGEFNVVSITRTELHDIFAYDDSSDWYKVKCTYDSTMEDDDKAKKVTQNFLVSASTAKEAYDRVKENLSTLMVDFELPSVVKTPIVEVFPFVENLDREISRTPIENFVKTMGDAGMEVEITVNN